MVWAIAEAMFTSETDLGDRDAEPVRDRDELLGVRRHVNARSRRSAARSRCCSASCLPWGD